MAGTSLAPSLADRFCLVVHMGEPDGRHPGVTSFEKQIGREYTFLPKKSLKSVATYQLAHINAECLLSAITLMSVIFHGLSGHFCFLDLTFLSN